MTAFAAAQISKDRLTQWQRRNAREQIVCTPAVLVNLTQGDQCGQIVLNTVEDLSDEQVLCILQRAVRVLSGKIQRDN